MSGSSTTCKRCGKGFVGASCPFCTVTGVDLEALLNAEEMKLMRQDESGAPVCLVDMVSGKAFSVVTPVCKIGRDLANDIPLAGDRSMSRFHCQIRQTGTDYFIEDCGSRNGTFLNGSPIATARKLQNGDIVSAGISRYKFSLKGADELLAAPSSKNGDQSAAPEANQAGVPTSFVSQEEIVEAREALQKLRGTVEPTEPQTVEPSVAEAEKALQAAQEIHNHDQKTQEAPKAKPTAAPTQKQPTKQDEMLKALTAMSAGGAPAWVDEYVLPELQKLMGERERLNGLLEEIRQDIKQIDRKIASTQGVSQALLSASGPELGQACKHVMEALDWQLEVPANNAFELSLKRSTKVEAVARVVVTQGDPSNKDFEGLVNQQAQVWCQFNYEPKGIMIVQISPDQPPKQRPALSKEFLESMRKKKICVVQPTQILAMYRLVLLSGHDKNYFKEMLLSTCGGLPGFLMKPQEGKPAPESTATA